MAVYSIYILLPFVHCEHCVLYRDARPCVVWPILATIGVLGCSGCTTTTTEFDDSQSLRFDLTPVDVQLISCSLKSEIFENTYTPTGQMIKASSVDLQKVSVNLPMGDCIVRACERERGPSTFLL
jgi:hypothetical protein